MPVPASRFASVLRRSLPWLLVLSLAANVGFLLAPALDAPLRSFDRLHPAFSQLSDDDADLLRFRFGRNHRPLFDQLNSKVPQLAAHTAAVYFETLNNGSQIDINDYDRMLPGSLRKIPLLAAIYKEVDRGNLKLNSVVELQARHLDLSLGVAAAVGPLTARGAGQKLTIQQLIEFVAEHSDNAATAALFELIGNEAYGNAMFGMGMSWTNFLDNAEHHQMDEYPASTYEFALAFRSLYYASYVRPKHADKILNLLANRNFPDGLPAGLPATISVAHKTGDWRRGNHHHDCGIVYFPRKPYLLCVMTRGMDKNAANRLIAEISRMTYHYVEGIAETG